MAGRHGAGQGRLVKGIRVRPCSQAGWSNSRKGQRQRWGQARAPGLASFSLFDVDLQEALSADDAEELL